MLDFLKRLWHTIKLETFLISKGMFTYQILRHRKVGD